MKDFTNKAINANLINGLQVLQGKIYFYEDGYVYKAEGVNSVISHNKIMYDQIKYVNPKKTLGFVPNGIMICLKNGERLNYVVSNRDDVIVYFQNKISGEE